MPVAAQIEPSQSPRNLIRRNTGSQPQHTHKHRNTTRGSPPSSQGRRTTRPVTRRQHSHRRKGSPLKLSPARAETNKVQSHLHQQPQPTRDTVHPIHNRDTFLNTCGYRESERPQVATEPFAFVRLIIHHAGPRGRPLVSVPL